MEDTATRVRRVIAKELCIEVDKVVDAARLTRDLHADHIDIVTIVMEVEDLLEVTVTDDAMEALRTVSDVIAMVDDAMAAAARKAA
jgi:acyl carrier protein